MAEEEWVSGHLVAQQEAESGLSLLSWLSLVFRLGSLSGMVESTCWMDLSFHLTQCGKSHTDMTTSLSPRCF